MKAKTLQIHWHEKQPVFSCEFEPVEPFRLVTCGADSCIRTWKVDMNSTDNIVSYLSTFSKHLGGVNVARWHPKGGNIASGGDDGSVIIWNQSESASTTFGQEAVESNEVPWSASTVIHSPTGCSIFDLCWSPDAEHIMTASDMDFSVRIFSVQTKQMLQQITHTLFVQGVAWDPLNKFAVSQSRDRSVRFYTIETNPKKGLQLSCTNKSSRLEEIKFPTAAANPNPNNNNTQETNTEKEEKKLHLYHNESLLTFFRRLTFSPDGSLVISPCGIMKSENNQSKEEFNHVVYVYARNCFKKSPIAYIGGLSQPATIIRFSPLKYKLLPEIKPMIHLPYRMIFAIGTREEIVIHDTQQRRPLAVFKRFHFDYMSDLAWSFDGNVLVASSVDGFCTLIHFEANELGDVF